MPEKKRVALLRGINVGGHRKLPMADLRALAAGLGWDEAWTHVQSGNLVFRAAGRGADLETALESAIADRFGFEVPVVVRDAAQWRGLREACPFPDAAEREPQRVLVGLAKRKIPSGAIAALRERAADDEEIALAAGALWFRFGRGAGATKLTPTVLDRAAASPLTTRNWRTVLAIADRLDS